MISTMRLAFALACLLPLGAAANPTGGTVTSGSATLSTSGSTLTITTGTSGTVINWNSFSIGAGETTRFNQPNASSATLNRVTGASSSSINGSLQSNGQVFLVNPNGIVFGAGSQVNAAGFVASTLSISDSDFLSRNLRFTVGGPVGSITGEANIVGDSYAALIGAQINVSGNVSAGSGGIVIAAGGPVTLTMSGGTFTSVSVGSSISGAAITVDGTINSTGPVFFQTGGGSSLPAHTPPTPILPPGNMVISPNTSNAVINWGFNTGGGTVNISQPSTVAQTAVTIGSGNVQIYGTLTATGTTVATSGVPLNLEKREFSF
jgi:filamentous hemagglutinin family protein